MDRVVLAYAGGFDVGAAIASLKSRLRAEVVAVTMDLGQGQSLEELRDRAMAAGAARAHVLDLRETFAANYVLPSLKADATAADGAPMAAALGRALVADKLVEVAGIEQAGTVAHGAVGADGSTGTFDASIRSLNPALNVVPVAGGAGSNSEAGHRLGANLWGRTIERAGASGGLEMVPERAFRLTRPVTASPGEPASVEIRFERGAPAAVNGVPMPLVELIGAMSHLAGAHGVGRLGTGEAVLEAPAAVVLHAAHRAFQQRKAPSKDGDLLSRQYADIIAGGQWSSPARKVLDRSIGKTQERVNGSITLKLFKGAYEIL
jgi:argininosuccinate synthase